MIRFRMYKIALSADIVKAFLMVAICPNVLSWHAEVPIVWWCQQREWWYDRLWVVLWSRAAPSYWMPHCDTSWQVHRFARKNREQADASCRLYVDDVITGANDEEEAYQLCLESNVSSRKAVLTSAIL